MKKLLGLLLISSFAYGLALAADAPASGPTPENATKGLQAALTSLVGQAMTTISDPKAANSQLSIPLPDKLQKLESALSAAGQGQLMEDFKAKLKSVALETLPQTKGAFTGATSGFKFDDALAVLNTGPDGLTNYVKQGVRGKIAEQVLPLIANNSKTAGLTASYQAMVAKVGPMAASVFGKQPPVNLDQYLTDQSVDFVFGLVGKGEGALRANPSLASNALVKQLFSAVKK